MSLADTIIRSAAPAYNVIHADTWTINSGPQAGQVFSGDAQTEAPVVLDTELSSDGREKTMLYVDRPIPTLQPNMQLSGKGALWKILGDIDDNPANDRVKFEIVKLVSGKDK